MLLALLLGGACDCPGVGIRELAPDVVVGPGPIIMDDTYVGVETTRDVVVENRGDVATEVAIDVTGEGFGTDSVQVNIAANGQTVVVVRFFPLRADTFNGTLTIRGDGVRLAASPVVEGEQEVALAIIGTVNTAPLCDDGNPCTDNVFDLATESCATTFHTRACGEEDACIAQGQCGNGECLGTPRVCAATAPCRFAYCDPDVGCAEGEIAGACDDGDPCTTDYCGERDCEHELAPDLTACGPAIQCVSADVCQSGACTTILFPDGIQCDDGNFCTESVCTNGACVGDLTPGTGNPELLSQALHFGGTKSTVIERANNGLLVFDHATSEGEVAPGGWLTQLQATTANGISAAPRVMFAPEGVDVNHIVGGPLSPWFGIGVWPSVTDVAFRQINGIYETKPFARRWRHAVFRDEVAYLCDVGPGLSVAALRGPAPIVAVPLAGIPDNFVCTDLALDTNTATLVVRVTDGNAGQILLFDLTNALEPVVRDTVLTVGGGSVAASEGRVAFVEGQFGEQDSVVVFPVFTPDSQVVLLAPNALTAPGFPAIIDGEVIMRWAPENNSPQGRLFRRPVTGNGNWSEVPEGQVRSLFAPSVIVGANHLALAGHQNGSAGLYLLNFAPGDETLEQPRLSYGPQGMLVPLPLGLASVASDRVTNVQPTFNPNLSVLFPMSTLPNFNEDLLTVISTSLGDTAIGPVRRGRRFPPNPNGFERLTTWVDVRQSPATTFYEARVEQRGGPTQPDVFDDDDVIDVAGAVSGDALYLVFARRNNSGPLVLQTYLVSELEDDGEAPWPVHSEVTLASTVRLDATSSPLAIAANGDRVAVYVGAEPDTEFVFLVDTAGAIPSVRATTDFNSFGSGHGPIKGLHVKADTILAVFPMYTIRYEADGLPLLSLNGVWEFELANVLAFDDDLIVVAGATSLDYFAFEDELTLTLVHSIPLEEQPIDIEKVGDIAYVTTDHGLAIVSPPCPTP